MSKSIPIGLAILGILGVLMILIGCSSESASSESDVTIKVTQGSNTGGAYVATYESDEIDGYNTNGGVLSIYLKDGGRIQTSMFTIETK